MVADEEADEKMRTAVNLESMNMGLLNMRLLSMGALTSTGTSTSKRLVVNKGMLKNMEMSMNRMLLYYKWIAF